MSNSDSSVFCSSTCFIVMSILSILLYFLISMQMVLPRLIFLLFSSSFLFYRYDFDLQVCSSINSSFLSLFLNLFLLIPTTSDVFSLIHIIRTNLKMILFSDYVSRAFYEIDITQILKGCVQGF